MWYLGRVGLLNRPVSGYGVPSRQLATRNRIACNRIYAAQGSQVSTGGKPSYSGVVQ
jgi:hypothetical protein